MVKMLLVIIMVFTVHRNAYAASVNSILKRIGVNELSPKTELNVNLHNLHKQQNVLLSSFKNKWTFVIFWKSSISRSVKELEYASRVALKLSLAGVSVVGISLDEDIKRAKNAVINLKLKIPNFIISSQGRRIYSSKVIPTTYLFSPDWKYVGKAKRLIGWTSASLAKNMMSVVKSYKNK